MNANNAPSWNTASSDQRPNTSPMELSALGEHLDRCKASRGRLFALQRSEEALHGFIRGHFVTTLVVLIALLVALIAVGSLIL